MTLGSQLQVLPSSLQLPLLDTHRTSPTVASFKRLTIINLTSNLNFTHTNNQYVHLTTDRTGTPLTRIRMGLSVLNAHRHRYNFIPYSTCTYCNTGAETPIHYFFTCTSHTLRYRKLSIGCSFFKFEMLLNKTPI